MATISKSLRAAVAVLALSAGASMSSGAVGSLSTPTELIAGGTWVASGYVVSYEVTQNFDATWHYEYSFRTLDGSDVIPNTSHFIIELSTNIDPEFDLFNFAGPIDFVEYDTYTSGSGNPGMPVGTSIFGLKVNTLEGIADFSFDSTRAPMWGDFYSKGGTSTFVYNADIGVPVADPDDYLSPALDGMGNPLAKILVPDTVIPAPGALALLGLAGIAASRRRR